MFLDLLEKVTDAEKNDKGQMELIAEFKNNADKTLCRLWEIDAVDSSSLADLNESELKQILGFANKIAAITCSRSGADSPWRKELD